MIRTILAATCLTLAGCQTGADTLAAAGVAPDRAVKIAADTATVGQLFCTAGGVLMAVAGVNVVGASASAVATACATAQAVGALTAPTTVPVPGPAPSGALAVLARASDAAAAAVKASQVVRVR